MKHNTAFPFQIFPIGNPTSHNPQFLPFPPTPLPYLSCVNEEARPDDHSYSVNPPHNCPCISYTPPYPNTAEIQQSLPSLNPHWMNPFQIPPDKIMMRRPRLFGLDCSPILPYCRWGMWKKVLQTLAVPLMMMQLVPFRSGCMPDPALASL